MGDQEKAGLATMGAFFRRYVGGDAAFDPYMTGELSEDGIDAAAARLGLPDVGLRHAHPLLRPADDELLRRAGRAPRRAPARDRQPARRSARSAPRSPAAASRTRTRTAAASTRSRRRPRAASTGATRSRRTSRRRRSASPALPTATKGCPLPGRRRARRPERRPRERAGQPLLRPAARARVGPAGRRSATRIPAAVGRRDAASRRSRWAPRSTSSTRATRPRHRRRDLEPGPDDPGLRDRR